MKFEELKVADSRTTKKFVEPDQVIETERGRFIKSLPTAFGIIHFVPKMEETQEPDPVTEPSSPEKDLSQIPVSGASECRIKEEIYIRKEKNKKIKFLKQNTDVLHHTDRKIDVLTYGIQQLYSVLEPPEIVDPNEMKTKFAIQISSHPSLNSKLPSKFKFKSFAPHVFRQIHRRCGISDKDFQIALNSKIRALTCSENTYQPSNGIFYLEFRSSVITSHEPEFLNVYYNFLTERQFRTMLPQFFGYFYVKLDHKTKYVQIRNNRLPNSHPLKRVLIGSDQIDPSISTPSSDAASAVSTSPKGISPNVLSDHQQPESTDITEPLVLVPSELARFEKTVKSDMEFLTLKFIKRWSFQLSVHSVPTTTNEDEAHADEVNKPISNLTISKNLPKNSTESEETDGRKLSRRSSMETHATSHCIYMLQDTDHVLCAQFLPFDFHSSQKQLAKNNQYQFKSQDSGISPDVQHFLTKLSHYVKLSS